MFKRKVSVLASLLLVASSGMALDWAADGKISGSPHDLTSQTAIDAGITSPNGELCVFCHTPHAADSSFSGAPLWNKSGPGAVTYLLYGAVDGAGDPTVGIAGKTIAGTAVGSATGTLSSPSLACLSCHDGVSAINSIVNAPGSGMGSLASPASPVNMTTYVATSTFGGDIGAGGAVGDVDMSNDHPVSVPYMGLDSDGTGATVNNSSYGSPASLRPKDANLEAISGAKWVGGTTIANLLRNGNVECSSCHDPHNGYAKTDTQGTAGSPQVSYLRQTNNASKLCLGCHDK